MSRIPAFQLKSVSNQILHLFTRAKNPVYFCPLLKVSDSQKRSLAEIPAELLCIIASFLDANTLFFGMSLLSRQMFLLINDKLNVNTQWLRNDLEEGNDSKKTLGLSRNTSHFRYSASQLNKNCYKQSLKNPISHIAMTKNENVIISSFEGELEIFNYFGSLLHPIEFKNSYITAMVPSPNGNILLVNTVENNTCMIQIIDIHSGELLHTIENLSVLAKKMCFNHDGSLLAVLTYNNVLTMIDMKSYRALQIDTLPTTVCFKSTISFSPNKNLFGCTIQVNGTVEMQIFDTTTWEIKYFFQVSNIASMAFNSDRAWLLEGSGNQVTLWNLEDLNKYMAFKCFSGHEHPIQSVQFSVDTQYIISISYHPDETYKAHNYGLLKIWDIATEQCVETRELSRNRIISACAIQDDHIFLGHTDGSLAHFTLLPISNKLTPKERQLKREERERDADAPRSLRM